MAAGENTWKELHLAVANYCCEPTESCADPKEGAFNGLLSVREIVAKCKARRRNSFFGIRRLGWMEP